MIKAFLQTPIDKGRNSETTRLLLKVICNLAKNTEILPQLIAKGMLDVLTSMLKTEQDKELSGNIFTAISYLSLHQDSATTNTSNTLVRRVLDNITDLNEVDQKMQLIALTSMLFNGIEVQREFIKNQGLSKMLHFLTLSDKVFHQLVCKCFAILSENDENLAVLMEKDCVNAILLSCFRQKDINLETLKEIVKIFTNLILNRKLRKEDVEITCRLCDLGLMVEDIDMNVLAVFCLNALSENFATHKQIMNSGLESFELASAKVKPLITLKGMDSQPQKSIFARLTFLIDSLSSELKQGPEDLQKTETLVTLLASFFMNMSRNEESRDLLLSLQLFRRFTLLLMSNMQDGKFTNKTALCYTNTVFAKLLKYHESRRVCIEEGGHNLFIKILQDPDNKHLYLETLETIKLFMTRREFLVKFRSIPESLKDLDLNCDSE
jgi:hypothetical protein